MCFWWTCIILCIYYYGIDILGSRAEMGRPEPGLVLGRAKVRRYVVSHTKLPKDTGLSVLYYMLLIQLNTYPGIQNKRVTRWLGSEEFGPDGHPLPDAKPPPSPPSPTSYQQQPASSFQYGNITAPASFLSQQSPGYAPRNEHANISGVPSQAFSAYQGYDNNLSRGSKPQKPFTSSRGRTKTHCSDIDGPYSSKESRRHHKKHSDRNSFYPQGK